MFPLPALELFIDNFFLTTAPQPLEVLKVIKNTKLKSKKPDIFIT